MRWARSTRSATSWASSRSPGNWMTSASGSVTRWRTQLAEGLALFSDTRTRSPGRERIEQLNQYRQVMNRIARSRLSPDLRRALSPVLAFAQTHAEQGQKLLNVIETYAALCDRLDTM